MTLVMTVSLWLPYLWHHFLKWEGVGIVCFLLDVMLLFIPIKIKQYWSYVKYNNYFFRNNDNLGFIYFILFHRLIFTQWLIDTKCEVSETTEEQELSWSLIQIFFPSRIASLILLLSSVTYMHIVPVKFLD